MKIQRVLEYIRLLRTEQWIKNIFVFLPMMFGGKLLDLSAWLTCLLAWFIFSLTASSIYCLNDSFDYKNDKNHPVKKNRPVASGKISPLQAKIISVLLILSVSIIVTVEYTPTEICILFIYWILNICYSLGLKKLPIIDVMIIAIGFVLRVLFGGAVTSIWVSPWMICMVFLLTLLLAFTKRRGDFIFQLHTDKNVRESVTGLNLTFMDTVISMLAAITMVSYFLFTMNEEVMARSGSPYIYITSIFVLAAIIRYLQIIFFNPEDNQPTRVITHDAFIKGCVLCWIISYMIIIYTRAGS